jgi:hypothetical protein
MERGVELSDPWPVLEAKLPSNWRALATEHGILTRAEQTNAGTGSGWKFDDPAALLRMILHYTCTGSSFKVTAALAAAVLLIDVSAFSLHYWMRRAGPWLAALVAQMLGTREQFAPVRWAGYDVVLVDATTVQKPGAKSTTARVHFALRLWDLRALAIHVTDAKVGETLRNFTMAARQLWIGDRGYSHANGIAHAVAAGADVLLRFTRDTLPLFTRAGEALNPRSLVPTLAAPGATGDWDVAVHPPKGKPIHGRLVAFYLPSEEAEKARGRLRREYKKAERTPERMQWAQYVVLFTTVPRAKLSTLQVLELYRARWAVELEFKREKSLGGLDELPSKLPETIHAWLCAKLLGLHLARRLSEGGEPFPPSVVGLYTLHVTLAQARAYAARHRA